MSDDENDRRRDESAIHTLSALYARAVDRGDTAAFAALFTEDAVLYGPGQTFTGRDEIASIPAMLKRKYTLTRHIVFNQTLKIGGDTAEGETYCDAGHIPKTDQTPKRASFLALRYQDRYRREDGRWLISERRLVVDWIESRSIEI